MRCSSHRLWINCVDVLAKTHGVVFRELIDFYRCKERSHPGTAPKLQLQATDQMGFRVCELFFFDRLFAKPPRFIEDYVDRHPKTLRTDGCVHAPGLGYRSRSCSQPASAFVSS